MLVDPVTKEALVRRSRLVADTSVQVTYASPSKVYGVKSNAYLDLVEPKKVLGISDLLETARSTLTRSRNERVQTDTFRSPLTAFLYERGWRQNFQNSGFPGIDKEFEELQQYIDFAQTTAVLDLSCGTGLMTRRIRSVVPESTRLIAADYSEAMLLETKRRLADDADRVELVRVDVAALPFKTDSIDAIHAGAAMHCWPKLETGLAEIARVLKPNGKFFATTFLKGALGTDRVASPNAGFRFFTLDELETLAAEAGFVNIQVRREGNYCAVLKSVAPDEEAS